MEIIERSIRETLLSDEKEILSVNVKYPELVGNEKACEKISGFYQNAAKGFYGFCKKKLYIRAKADVTKNGSEKYGAVMNYTVSYSGDEYICVLLDASVYDGREIRSQRTPTVWSKKGGVLSASDFLGVSKGDRKNYVYQIRQSLVYDHASYKLMPEFEKRADKYFDFTNFCLTQNGPAFFYPKNTVCFGSDGFPTFIVHTAKK